MKIKQLFINNFRSLNDFTIDFSDLNFLIGYSAEGKSSVIEALKFLSLISEGKSPKKDFFRGDYSSKIQYKILIENLGDLYIWKGIFDTKLLKCSEEEVYLNESLIFKAIKDEMVINSEEAVFISDYIGSALSKVPLTVFNTNLLVFIKEIKNLLSVPVVVYPSTFLKVIKETISNRKAIPAQNPFVKAIYSFTDYERWIDKGCSKYLREIVESGKLKHALIGEYVSLKLSSPLLIEEIENSFHFDDFEFVIKELLEYSKNGQIITTTMNPLLLNVLTDDLAKSSVILIYKDIKEEISCTKAIPFFSIPKIKERLKYMGAGEVYADADIRFLIKEL